MSQTNDRENRIGLAFPMKLSEDGRLMSCTYEEHIKQSLRTLLSTARGERVMRREFGNRLGAYLFENIGATTTSLIKREITSTVERFERRVELTDVRVQGGTANPALLSVELAYRIKSTGVADQLSLKIGK